VKHPVIPVALMGAVLATGVAGAQTQRSGGGGASPQIMQQYQQLSAERVSLLAENTRLKKEAADAATQLAALRKERDTLKGQGARSAHDIEQARATGQAAEAAAAKNRQALEELVARFRETALALKSVEAERVSLGTALANDVRALDACTLDNAGLYAVASEVLDRWEHEGFFTKVGRAESFMRLKRTEIENLADQYRDRARALKLKSAGGAAPGSPPPMPPTTP